MFLLRGEPYHLFGPEEILQEWNDITKNIQADIVVLDMPLLDTTQFKDSLGWAKHGKSFGKDWYRRWQRW